MRARSPQDSLRSGHPQEDKKDTAGYRPFWLCLPVMLALSAIVLLLFGVSWWTALIVILLLACPAATGVAIYFGLFQGDTSKGIGRPDRGG